MASYLDKEKVPALSATAAREIGEIAYDPDTGHVMWHWESDEGYEFSYEFDFQGVDISVYDDEIGEFEMVHSVWYEIKPKVAHLTNQIIDKLNSGEKPEDIDINSDSV